MGTVIVLVTLCGFLLGRCGHAVSVTPETAVETLAEPLTAASDSTEADLRGKEEGAKKSSSDEKRAGKRQKKKKGEKTKRVPTVGRDPFSDTIPKE